MAKNNTFKFACSHCGQHIEAECDMIGMAFDCPACGQHLNVPEKCDVSHEPEVSSENCDPNHAPVPASEVVRDTLPNCPVIKVIKKRERFIDRCKMRVKSVGIGIVVLLLFVGVAVINDGLDEVEPRVVENGETIDNVGEKHKAVAASIQCLLNFIRRPNDRRLQALLKSLEPCPKDFQGAVKRFLDSSSQSVDNILTVTEKDVAEEIERELYSTIRRGSPVDTDPRLAVVRELAVTEAESKVKKRMESHVESAKRKIKEEIENAVKRLVDVAEKYGIDPDNFEDALLD